MPEPPYISGFLSSLFKEATGMQDQLRFFVIAQWSHAQSGRTFTIKDLREYEKAAGVMYDWHDRIVEKIISLN